MLPMRALLVYALSASASALAFYPVADKKLSSPVKTALKKKSGALSVAIEVSCEKDGVAPIDEGELVGDGRRTVALTLEERLAKLSSELRGGREGSLANALFASDVGVVSVLAKEQASAKGDFPGPCPVVYSGDAAHAEAAIDAGAQGVMLSAAELDVGKTLAGRAEVLWRVASAEEVHAVVADDHAPEDAFVLDGAPDAAAELLAALPAHAVGMASLDPMQADDGEIADGRSLAAGGCRALLVRRACVGDGEDVPYSRYVVKQLTSKRSSAFKIDGHTGSINGHFGGGRATSGARPEGGWARAARDAVQ